VCPLSPSLSVSRCTEWSQYRDQSRASQCPGKFTRRASRCNEDAVNGENRCVRRCIAPFFSAPPANGQNEVAMNGRLRRRKSRDRAAGHRASTVCKRRLLHFQFRSELDAVKRQTGRQSGVGEGRTGSRRSSCNGCVAVRSDGAITIFIHQQVMVDKLNK